MKEVFTDTLIDFVKLLPFLFLTYLLMEFIEHKTGEKSEQFISRAGRFGPVIGGLLGAVPQCGFSASAAGLYTGRIITVGTLVAIFLSTSDEMVPVCLSQPEAGWGVILKILAAKVVAGIVLGLIVDLVVRMRSGKSRSVEIHSLCENDNCHCDEENMFASALRHTVKIALFILIITFALNCAVFFIGEDNIGKLFVNIPVVGCAVASLIGLIPNCAASVVITQLFLEGVIGTGAMLSGLLTGAGLGLLVLFRLNKNIKENLAITATVYFLGVLVGSIVELTGISFI